ncbi:aminoglycoside phosphotransferase (APT) family kinase protein [Salirhabdus euzebyi]|uniref:Aminoglycoside phosphotransferase (APT) family kinase protein n=1 Tax=Salirhabdus euzebyi TaxID=394506 RepID=A0A841QAU1_9BACI|nr:phosphotransferase [Salirhabdus euzebyi]MBB6455337.1 aminoglycoside phosphotransferase (APT) family kinase protein [Salirhabdus euzebyi]
MIKNILRPLGLSSCSVCEEVHGGRDSQVYKLIHNDVVYALRILPSPLHEQFLMEEEKIKMALENGIPVPKIYSVRIIEDYSVMLMEWCHGKTVFQELIENPNKANELGFEFGRIQASINKVSFSSVHKESRSWLLHTPEEAQLLEKVPHESMSHRLLHLDYHPLNVLTDGKQIVGVIDWANATFGDYRFDVSRTKAILGLEGAKHLHEEVLMEFEQGWRKGYEHILLKSLETVEGLPLFNAWAGLRMKRDLADVLTDEDYERIEVWIQKWLLEDSSNRM